MLGSATSIATMGVVMRADPAQFIKGFAQAEGGLSKFSEAVQFAGRVGQSAFTIYDRMGTSLENFGRRLRIVSASGQAFNAFASKQAGDLETRINNVRSITARLGEFDYQAPTLELSEELPKTAEDLADALYDITSSGFTANEAITVLESSAIAAAAGLTTTENAAQGITAVLNAFGLEASRSDDVADILFQTVNKGVLTFEQLTASTGNWAAQAATAGVAADEAAAAIAAMTLAGITPDEAATSLGRIMDSLVQPTQELLDVVQAFGYESGVAAINALGLEGTINLIGDAAGGSIESLSGMFDEVRARRGVFALLANDGANYAEVSASITDEAERLNAAHDALEIQMESASAQFQVTRNQVHNLVVEYGQSLLPVMKFGNDVISKMIGLWELVPGPLKTLIQYSTAGATALSGLAGIFLVLQARSILWRLSMRLLANQITNVSGRIPILSRRFGNLAASEKSVMGLANAFRYASTRSGPLSTGWGAIGLATKGVRQEMTGLTTAIQTTTGVIGGAVTAAVTFVTWRNALRDARKEGKATAQSFAENFDISTLDSYTEQIEGIAERIKDLREADQANSEGLFGWLGDQVFDYTPFVTGDDALSAEIDELERIQELAVQRQTGLRELYGSIILEQEGFQRDLERTWDLGGPLSLEMSTGQSISAVTDVIEELENLGIPADMTIERFDALARAAGISGEAGMDLSTVLRDLWENSTDTSAATEELSIDVANLAGDFALAQERIDKFGEVLEDSLRGSFGFEDARDTIEGSINDIFQSIEEMKEAGTFDEAMNLGSFHEDALSLREDMRGLLEDVSDGVLEWAATQENLTGDQLLAYLREQAGYIRSVGRELGLSEEFINHYVDALYDVSEAPQIEDAFDRNGTADVQEDIEGILRSFLLTTEQIESMLDLMSNFGSTTEDVYAALGELGLDDPAINMVMTLETERVASELAQFMTDNGIDQGEMRTFLEIVVDAESDAEIQTALQGLLGPNYSEGKFTTLMEIIGEQGSFTRMEGVGETLRRMDGSVFEAAFVLGMDEYNESMARIQTELNELDGRVVRVPIQLNPTVTGAPNMSFTPEDISGILGYLGQTESNAWGGISEQHTPGIYSTMRVFAEPETGGEAYIPLAHDARRPRAVATLEETARRFNMKVMPFALGGFNIRPPDADSGTPRPPLTKQSPGNYSSRFRVEIEEETTSGGGGGGSAQEPDPIDWMEIFDRANKVGELSNEQYMNILQDKLATTQKFSDEWMDAWNEINDLQEEEIDRNTDIIDNWLRIGNWRLEQGELTLDQVVAYYDAAIAMEERYSERWMTLMQERDSIVQDAEDQRLEAAERQNDITRWRFENDEISGQEYLNSLYARLHQFERYSTEWMDLMDEINSVSEQLHNDEMDRNRIMFDTGNMSQESYVSFLRNELKSLTEFSSEWYAIWNELQDFEPDLQTGIKNGLQDWMGSGIQYSGRYLSENQLFRFYMRQAEDAETWAATVNRLAASGMVNPTLMRQIIEGGPASLPLAQAIERLVTDGRISQINSAYASVQSLQSGFQMSPTQAPLGSGTMTEKDTTKQQVSTTFLEVGTMHVGDPKDPKEIVSAMVLASKSGAF